MTANDDHFTNDSLIDIENATVLAVGHQILSEVNWSFNPGEHWVIVGPNGAGKTTLARLLTGRASASEGHVSVLGKPVADHSSADLASQIGFASVDVGQAVPPHEKTIDFVLSAAWGQSVRFGEEYEAMDTSRAEDLLAALGVGGLGERPFMSLSEGERRRVLLARSLMADPEVLILDEPTAGLDLGGREILVQALGEIMDSPDSPGVILITHELEEIGPYFTHALLLDEGRVAASGPIEEVFTAERLSSLFGLDLAVNHVGGRWMATAKEA